MYEYIHLAYKLFFLFAKYCTNRLFLFGTIILVLLFSKIFSSRLMFGSIFLKSNYLLVFFLPQGFTNTFGILNLALVLTIEHSLGSFVMEQKNINYSYKNIPIPENHKYKLGLLRKIETFISNMRWKAYFFINSTQNNQRKNVKFMVLETINILPKLKN